MTNQELIQFAQTWKTIGSDAQEMIEPDEIGAV